MSDPVVVVAPLPPEEPEGQLQDYSVDQLGGFVVMVAGAIGSLLLVVWQSKCHCRMNLCYIFQCERRPPSEEEMKSLKDQSKALKDKKNKNKKTTPGPPARTSKDKLYDIESPTDEEFNDPETEPEPEPEPQRV